MARPAEKAKMAIFRSASGCGFGYFSPQNSKNSEKGEFGNSTVARVHATVDCQSDILPRNSQKDRRPESAANQPLPSDWRFCKCGLVIPRWLPIRFAQALIEESGEQNRMGDFGDHKIPRPPFTKPPLYPAPTIATKTPKTTTTT